MIMLSVAVARSSDHSAIGCTSVFLWSCFRGMGQIQIRAWNVRCSELFTVIHQVALGAKSALVDCFVCFDLYVIMVCPM